MEGVHTSLQRAETGKHFSVNSSTEKGLTAGGINDQGCFVSNSILSPLSQENTKNMFRDFLIFF